MADKKITQDSFYELLITQENILLLRLKGMIKLDQMKKIQSSVDDSIPKNKIKLFLIDQTEMKIMPKDVMEQIKAEFDSLENMGIQKMAIVEARDVFAVSTANKLHSEVKIKSLSLSTFKNEIEARSWLLS